MMKNEFKMPNQEAGTSATGAQNSLFNIQKTNAQIITKLVPRKMFDNAYFLNVFLKRLISTTVKITIGTTTSNEFAHLKIEALLPDKTRLV